MEVHLFQFQSKWTSAQCGWICRSIGVLASAVPCECHRQITWHPSEQHLRIDSWLPQERSRGLGSPKGRCMLAKLRVNETHNRGSCGSGKAQTSRAVECSQGGSSFPWRKVRLVNFWPHERSCPGKLCFIGKPRRVRKICKRQ